MSANLDAVATERASPGDPDDAGPVPVFTIDTGSRRLVAANAEARVAWGLDGREVAALPVELDAAMPALAALAGGADGDAVPLVFWTLRGAVAWTCRVRQLRAEGGGVARVTIAGRDATAAARTPAARGAGPAEPTGRAGAEKGAMAVAAGRLAHELRTPLSAIVSMADVMAEARFGPLADARYEDYARSISRTARHAIGVVGAMLAPAVEPEAESGPTFTELDLNEVAADALSSVERLAGDAGLALQSALADGLPRVIADRIGVQQIVLNLLANGLAHAGAGTRMTVRSGSEPCGEAWLEVEDDGPGIPPLLAAAVAAGEPLPCRNERRAAGTGGQGIGLTLAAAIARQNGARLGFAAVDPHGARVRLTFGASRTVPV